MRIKIVHIRKDNPCFDLWCIMLYRMKIRKSSNMAVNGLTNVRVILPDGKEYSAWAICHSSDSFSKKKGVQTAKLKISLAHPELGVLINLGPIVVASESASISADNRVLQEKIQSFRKTIYGLCGEKKKEQN